MKITLSLVFVLTCMLSPARAADSLEMAGLVSRARARMNVDANTGKKILDSLRTKLSSAETHPFFWGEYYKLAGIFYYRRSMYDSALAYYALAREKYSTLGSRLELAKILVNTSMVYNRMGNFDQTIVFAIDAL